MYLLKCWFHLSDEGVEDAIYDSYAFRKFMGINFLKQDAPDAKTLLHFRHLPEEIVFQKVPYRGFAKNENRLYALFVSANLYVLGLAGRSICKT